MGIDIQFIDELKTNLIQLVDIDPKKYREYAERARKELDKLSMENRGH